MGEIGSRKIRNNNYINTFFEKSYFNFKNIFKKYYISKLYDKLLFEKYYINRNNIPDYLNNYNNNIFKYGREIIKLIFKFFFPEYLKLFAEYKNKSDEEIENFVKNLISSKEKKILNIAKTFIIYIFGLFKMLKINPFFSKQLIAPKNESEKKLFLMMIIYINF